MKRFQKPLACAFASSLISTTSATIVMDYVTVGDPGNAADPLTGFGAVGYEYQISKYEVTNAQYGTFLNAVAKTDSYGLYNSNMSSYGITQSGSSGSFTYSVTGGFENKPVVWVSWFDAARFSNWLNNGQGNSDTETGSYTLLGATSGIITVNTGAKAWIPTENEWYKAAYYNGANSTYALYPNDQNTITTADANYENSVGSTTDVGTYTSDPSYYGTFDQGGNVYEWTDELIIYNRVGRGGSWYDTSDFALSSLYRPDAGPEWEDSATGFRVAVIPEPTSVFLTMLASGVMLIRRKR